MESLQSLRHERIVRYINWYQDVPGRWILVMEYCQHGNLEQMMKDRKAPFKKAEIAEILKQTAEGLSYIHSQHTTHRDLKPDNILLRSEKPLSLALADFGPADRKSESRSRMETICGTPPYMAPEMWGARYTDAVDIWALGVVGLALMNKGLPTPPGTRPPNYSEFVFDEIDNMFIRNPTDRLVANVRKMLAEDPKGRLPADECFEDAEELLDFLRTNKDQDGQYSGRSSREPSNQTFGSSELRAIEEKISRPRNSEPPSQLVREQNLRARIPSKNEALTLFHGPTHWKHRYPRHPISKHRTTWNKRVLAFRSAPAKPWPQKCIASLERRPPTFFHSSGPRMYDGLSSLLPSRKNGQRATNCAPESILCGENSPQNTAFCRGGG